MISLHYTSDRVIRFRCANTIIYIQGIPGSYGYRSLEIIYYIEDIQAPTDIPAKDHFFFKERSGREGMTVVSVLLGEAVEVGVEVEVRYI